MCRLIIAVRHFPIVAVILRLTKFGCMACLIVTKGRQNGRRWQSGRGAHQFGRRLPATACEQNEALVADNEERTVTFSGLHSRSDW